MNNYICPNNRQHTLEQSKKTPSSYICNECEGFACWDISELTTKYNENDLIKINEFLLRQINNNFTEAIPFYFRVEKHEDKLILKTVNIVDGSVSKKENVHLYTQEIIEYIIKDLNSKFNCKVFWI